MKQAIVRLVVLFILLVNQAFVAFGWDPLPFDEEAIYTAASSVATVAAALWAWYKDNPVTKQGQHNDKFLRDRNMKK